MNRRDFLKLLGGIAGWTLATCLKPTSPAEASRVNLASVDSETHALWRQSLGDHDHNHKMPMRLVPSILIIGWDGVQWDHIKELWDRDRLPVLKGLCRTLWRCNVTTAGTFTKPGWVEILTGYDAAALGIPDNKSSQAVPAGLSIFERAKAVYPQLRTFMVCGKGPNIYIPFDIVRSRLDFFASSLPLHRQVFKQTKEQLKLSGGAYLGFMHFCQPDKFGHAFGENSPEYSAQIIQDDLFLGRTLRWLAKQGLGTPLIYVISDHGFDEGLRRHRNAPYSFLATNDPTVIRDADRKDLAAHILWRLGLPYDDLDGKPLHEMPYPEGVPEGKASLDYQHHLQAPCQDGLVLEPLPWQFGRPPTGGTGDNTGICRKIEP